MGRAGVAMTFVTPQNLGDLKSLFELNHIDPVWHGTIPDLQNLKRKGVRGPMIRRFKHFKEKAAIRTLDALTPLNP
jgi:hypothetical protein